MTLLVTVETSEMAQILASRTGYVGGMDTNGWGGVFPSLFGGFIPRISSRPGLGFGKLDGLKILEKRRPIVNFLPLVLGVLPNSTLDSIYQSTGVTKTLSKKSFELDPRQEIFDCLVFPTLVLVPMKADPITKERSCKRGAIGACGAGDIKIVLALVSGLRVWDDWLEPGGINPCRTCHCLKVFLGVYDGSSSGD